MHSKSLLDKAIVCAALIAAHTLAMVQLAHSAVVTFDFNVLITSVSTSGNVSNIPDIGSGIVANSTTITGTFSYDVSQLGNLFGSTTQFTSGPSDVQVSIPSGSYFYSTSSPGTYVSFNMNDNNPVVFDRLEMNAGDGFVPTGIMGSLSLGLIDSSNTAFASQSALPTSINLSDFNTRYFFFTLQENSNFNLVGYRRLQGQITSIEELATPLPTALPLFATGLGLMGLLGWQRKRKAVAAGEAKSRGGI